MNIVYDEETFNLFLSPDRTDVLVVDGAHSVQGVMHRSSRPRHRELLALLSRHHPHILRLVQAYYMECQCYGIRIQVANVPDAPTWCYKLLTSNLSVTFFGTDSFVCQGVDLKSLLGNPELPNILLALNDFHARQDKARQAVQHMISKATEDA